MAKSNAKKKREHLARNGRRDPNLDRGTAADFSTHVRQTPTLRTGLLRQERKHKLAVYHSHL